MFFNSSLLAIDIGSSAIKVVEMSGKTEKKLINLGMELIPEGAIVNGSIQDAAIVTKSLRRLLRRLKIRVSGRKTAISLGGSSVIIKKINYPNKDEIELADMIEAEAEQHFQHDLNELYFTWNLLDSSEHAEERSVIMVAVKKNLLDQYISVIKNAGLKIAVIDCDVFSIFNMFEYNFGAVDGLIAIANIGASSTQVTLSGNGQYLYTRDISIGGNTWSKSIASSLNTTLHNAESMKIAAGEGDISSAVLHQDSMKKITDQLANEIQVTIDYFFQSNDAPAGLSKVQAVFLTGGGARTPGLDATIASTLNIPVTIVNPFHKVKIPKKLPMDHILSQGHIYSVAVGLSMRSQDDYT
ncbi:MAG: type IV pilus assembly protein PilM [Deltaproteobacteria bacterium]|nr:type IV pilus assembly protein PilM [Deltaproteobacteria bacterium]